MCLTLPGKIIEINQEITIDYGDEKRKAETSVVDISIGDYVIVKEGIIIGKVDKQRAQEFIKMLEKKIWTYEEVLFRFSISCLEDRYNSGRMDKQRFEKIVEYAQKSEIPPIDLIKEFIQNAIKKIHPKTPEAVEDYFLKEHNNLIDRREEEYANCPEEICEICKAKKGIVKEILDRNLPTYLIECEDGSLDYTVHKYFPEQIKVGDKIISHNKIFVKKL
ncbi:MAG: HypC/HybG/HupF family hydrogenase formation chaperone [Nanoarchaeota archaeon]